MTVAVEQRCGQVPRSWLRMKMNFGSFSSVVRKEMQLPNVGKMLSGQGQMIVIRGSQMVGIVLSKVHTCEYFCGSIWKAYKDQPF